MKENSYYEKLCVNCRFLIKIEVPVNGERNTDKKFCNDYCRRNYHYKNRLTAREKQIVHLRQQGKTLVEIGKQFDISKQAISVILQKVEKKMRHLEYMKMRLKEEEMKDMVNQPEHYTSSSIETIDMIESITAEGFHYYLEGNILKYLARYRHKNGIQDLEKAQWYLNKLIEVQHDTSDGDVHTEVRMDSTTRTT